MAHKKRKSGNTSGRLEKQGMQPKNMVDKEDLEDDYSPDERSNGDTNEYDDTHERRRRSRRAIKNKKNVINRSTLYFSIAFALVLGIYLGTMLPSFFNTQSTSMVVTGQTEISPEVSKIILDLEQTVLKNPDDLASWISLGNLYFDAHQHEDAIVAYEKSLELKADNVDVLTDLGTMYRAVGRYEKAVNNFAKAIKVNPKHENALFNRGVVLYFDLNRKEDARNSWRALLKANPSAKAPDGKSIQDLIDGNF